MQKIQRGAALIGVLSLAALWTTGQPALCADNFSHKVDPNAVVTTDEAPHTKSQIIDYLAKMRRIINRYDSTMMSMMGGTGGGLKLDPNNLGAASAQTQRLAQEIQAIVPPKDIAGEHNKLATSMGSVDAFLAKGGNSLTAMPEAFALAGEVQQTHAGYHSAVLKLIDSYGLNRSLDPFSDESAEAKTQAGQGLADMKNQLTGDSLNFGPDGLNNGGGAASGMINGLTGGGAGGGALGGMAGRSKVLGGSQSGAMGNGAAGLGDLGGLLGGGGAGGLGDLGKMLGGGGTGGLGGLEKLLGGAGGGAGGGGGGGGGGGLGGALQGSGDLGSLLKNIDLNGLMKQMGGGQSGTGTGSGSSNPADPANGGLEL